MIVKLNNKVISQLMNNNNSNKINNYNKKLNKNKNMI